MTTVKELLTRIVILQRFRSNTSSSSGVLCVDFYAKHEHKTGIAGVSQFLFLNLTFALIRLYPCDIKDDLRLDELRIPIAPEPAPEKKRPPQV